MQTETQAANFKDPGAKTEASSATVKMVWAYFKPRCTLGLVLAKVANRGSAYILVDL